MTKEELIQLIGKGENQTVEFKKAKDTLPNSIWETYSAFANTDGGLIILGIAEQKGEFIADGVNAPDKIIKELESGKQPTEGKREYSFRYPCKVFFGGQ